MSRPEPYKCLCALALRGERSVVDNGELWRYIRRVILTFYVQPDQRSAFALLHLLLHCC
jgi:hypothetical protein